MHTRKTIMKAHHWTKNLLIAALSAAWAVGASAAPNAAVLAQASAEKPAVIETLRQLVSIESGSRDKEGLDRIADVLAARLQKLGAEVQLVDPGADTVRMHDTPAALGKVVVGRFQGRGTKNILILAHMDTVYPHGTLAKRPFRIENTRAYGPGIADDKGGIAVILHTLSILKTLNYRDYGKLTIAINGDEEISTPGARKLIERLGSEHDYVFSCEPSPAPKDVLALATSGIGAAMLTVRGKSSHAGVNPQDGRNALMELAHQLSHSGDLGDPARSIKFNWTMANAGTTRNVIPDTASAAADVRVQRVADYDVIEKAFYARMQQGKLIADTQLEPSFERRRPPLEVSATSRALAGKAQAIFAELGKKLDLDDSGSGGGTDAAFAGLSGKAAVAENFGLMGYGYHSSNEEFVELDSIEPRLYLLTRLIMEVARP